MRNKILAEFDQACKELALKMFPSPKRIGNIYTTIRSTSNWDKNTISYPKTKKGKVDEWGNLHL